MANNIYFELFDKYFDSFAVNISCNLKNIFGSVVYKLISLTVRLGCLCLIQPSFVYCDMVCDNLSKDLATRLQKLQNRAVKVI